MTLVVEFAPGFVDRAIELDPCVAILDAGVDTVSGLTDYSPAGYESRADLAARARSDLLRMEPVDPRDALLRDHLLERTAMLIDFHSAGEDMRELHPVVTGPLQLIAQSVALAVPGDWDQALLRLRDVPTALANLRAGLGAAAQRGQIAAARQVDECVRRCPGWAAETGRIAQRYGEGSLARDFASAAFRAGAAYGEMELFLKGLRAQAPMEDAVGEERYRLWVRRFLGAEPDLRDLYAWGWDEFRSIEAEMRREAAGIAAGGTPADAVEFLDGPDGLGKVPSREAFGAWLQQMLNETTARLDGVHFRIPEPMCRIDCTLAVDSGIFYTPPSHDLSRPGRVTWSLREGEGPFDTWHAYSTLFHEGVPGHHLQLGLAAVRGDALSQRLEIFGGRSACYEGWALYAETLMDELGFFRTPGSRLGYLMSQALRAARVILDTGMHLKLRAPDGEVVTPEYGRRMLVERDFIGGTGLFELVRYLGRPGQALSYKAGERVYREVRARSSLDLATFHERVLSVDGCGLAHLRTELERVALG